MELPHFRAVLLVASRVRVQLLHIKFLGCIVLVEGLVLLDQMVGFVGASSVQDGVLVVWSDSRLLAAIVKTHLCVVNCVGECRRGTRLYSSLFWVL